MFSIDPNPKNMKDLIVRQIHEVMTARNEDPDLYLKTIETLILICPSYLRKRFKSLKKKLKIEREEKDLEKLDQLFEGIMEDLEKENLIHSCISCGSEGKKLWL